jgi:hypothetical protein
MVFLFADAVLVLETNLAGKPLGVDGLDLDDEMIVALPAHACEMAELDSRNALLWVREIRAARLSGRRKYGLFCLELRTQDDGDFTFYWRAKHAWRTVEQDGAFPVPDHAERVAVEDLRRVFGTLLVDETT